MKHVLMALESAACVPLDALQGRTPLQAARVGTARTMAREGATGFLRLSREQSASPLSLLGTALGLPARHAELLAAGPLAALALDLPVRPDEQVWLGRFLTMDGPTVATVAAPTSVSEQTQLLEDLQAELRVLGYQGVRLHDLRAGLFLLVLPHDGAGSPELYHPEDLPGRTLDAALRGHSATVSALLLAAHQVLSNHPINQVRVDLGENPLNGIWCWGGGGMDPVRALPHCARPSLLVSPDEAGCGLGRALGMKVLRCESPYSIDRFDAAFDVGRFLKLLEAAEDVVVYLPLSALPGTVPGAATRVKHLEQVDYFVTNPLKAVLDKNRPVRFCLFACGTRGDDGLPAKGVAPLLFWGEEIAADEVAAWDEFSCESGSLGPLKADQIMERLRE